MRIRIRGPRTTEDQTSATVTRLLTELTPAAVLLTDDGPAAVRLLAAALSAPGGLEDVDSARRSLARQAGGRPRWAAEQVIETTAPDTPADDDAVLADALRALPPSERATVVLGDGADPATAGLRKDLARRDDEARRERVRTAELYRAPRSVWAPEEPAVPLPERLARLAAGRTLPSTAAAAISETIREARRNRGRRGLRIAAGAVVAALLAALVPLLPQDAPRTASVYDEPTRGVLAGNSEFVAAMAEAPWPGAPGSTGDRRVVFVDDVPGARWALVAAGGTSSRPAAIAWFTGPSGASPDRMRLSSSWTAPDPSMPVSLTDPRTGAMVVVAAPDDRIAVSARPEIDADGSVTRSFRDVHTTRGLAVEGLTPVPGATVNAARIQVTRDHRRLEVRPPAVLAGTAASATDVPVVALRPATPSVLEDAAVESRVRSVLGQLGQVPTATPVTALWSGDLPGPTRLSVLAVEQPSGAVVITAPYTYTAYPAGRGISSWCATGVLPAGVPLEQRVVALRCDFRDRSIRAEISRFLVVVGPRSATEVRLLDDAGTLLSEHALDDGVAVVRSPGDVAELAVTAATGEVLRAVPLVQADIAG